MTVHDLLERTDFKAIYLADGNRPVSGVYAGDLLSWVMGRAKENQAFVTIMTNINVIAVATLAELSCVVFCEDVLVSEDILAAAREKQINLIHSSLPAFETCVVLGRLFE